MLKQTILYLFLTSTFIGCSQKKRPLLGNTAFQKEINAEFIDASKSPLTKMDRENFKGLSFFKFDSTFVVTANFKKINNAQPFEMKTTTDRLPIYIPFGIATFNLNGKEHTLKLYQSVSLTTKSGYENYLFLPFLDTTNGKESYNAGRYIDCEIPKENTIIIDFNKAYNPYCAYNTKYSCPIVPSENYLDTAVKAGVKAYKKH